MGHQGRPMLPDEDQMIFHHDDQSVRRADRVHLHAVRGENIVWTDDFEFDVSNMAVLLTADEAAKRPAPAFYAQVFEAWQVALPQILVDFFE